MIENKGVPASPSGSRASHGASDESPPEASIPNAVVRDLFVALEKSASWLSVHQWKLYADCQAALANAAPYLEGRA